jgi:hypothetical protein
MVSTLDRKHSIGFGGIIRCHIGGRCLEKHLSGISTALKTDASLTDLEDAKKKSQKG